MPLARDLLHPSPEEEKRCHKKKRLVQSPNSYFMDVKCPGCYKITTVFSHAQTVVLCVGCSTVLCQPTGGRARLTEGQSLFTYYQCSLLPYFLQKLQGTFAFSWRLKSAFFWFSKTAKLSFLLV
uniref:40S ribosomal protein S27-like n=1 Tax=Styela clava TaxID=7725 RepID=UPI001939BA29|nr:40S ribosomal protein S27-like [Styela clava]